MSEKYLPKYILHGKSIAVNILIGKESTMYWYIYIYIGSGDITDYMVPKSQNLAKLLVLRQKTSDSLLDEADEEELDSSEEDSFFCRGYSNEMFFISIRSTFRHMLSVEPGQRNWHTCKL